MAPQRKPGSALVTGAARRIGKALAIRLAEAGYDIALHASERSAEEARALAAQIAAGGRRAEVFLADLSDAAQAGALVSRAVHAMGPLSLLVNNASVFEADDAADFSANDFDRMMRINLRAPLQLSSAFAALAPEDGDACIINLLDQRVWRLNPRYFSYTLTKSALWTATQTMAQSFAPRVRVNGVGPGPTLANHVEGAQGFEREAASVLLARAVSPAEIADAVLYLAGARGVTGQMIAVDGGQHLAWRTPDVA